MIILTVPDLGPLTEPLRITAWLVLPGELVRRDDPVVELGIGGLVADVTAPCGGRVVGPLPPLDQVVQPGQPLARIEPTPASAGESLPGSAIP